MEEIRLQVLNGCRQSVPWEVRLAPQTDEIPAVNFDLTVHEIYKISFGAKTSRYGPHGLGYRRATITFTKWCKTRPFFIDIFFFYFLLEQWYSIGRKIIKKKITILPMPMVLLTNGWTRVIRNILLINIIFFFIIHWSPPPLGQGQWQGQCSYHHWNGGKNNAPIPPMGGDIVSI